MKTVRNECWKQPENGYIGTWYQGEYSAQPIILTLSGQEQTSEFDTEILGGGYTNDQWHGRELRIYFKNCEVITCYEAEKFLDENKDLIQALYDSYEEKRDFNGDLKGRWNDELAEKLQQIANDFQSEFAFWEEEED